LKVSDIFHSGRWEVEEKLVKKKLTGSYREHKTEGKKKGVLRLGEGTRTFSPINFLKLLGSECFKNMLVCLDFRES
jgi:hypothetical protein